MRNNAIALVYQFISYIAVFVVLSFVGIIMPKTTLFSITTYQTTALFLTVIFTGLYFSIELLRKESQSLIFSKYDIVFILFIALVFLSSIWARNPIYTYNTGFQWLVFYGVYKLIQHFSSIEKQLFFLLQTLTGFFLISLTIVFILFLTTADYSSNFSSIFHSEQFNLIRKYYGLYRNYISSFLVIGTGIPLYWIIKSKSKWQIILSSAFLGYFAFVLMLSRSRGSLLAFGIVLCLFYMSNFFRKIISWQKTGFSVLFLSVTILTALVLQADESDYLFYLNPFYGVQSASGDGRLQMWDISFQLICEQPWLGYGAGSWEFEYQKYGAGDLKNHSFKNYFYKHSHNYFIDTLFTTGILGLIGFTFLILLYPLWVLYKKIKMSRLKPTDYLLFSGIIAYNIIAMFYGVIYTNVNEYVGQTVLLFCLIGLLNENKVYYFKEKLLFILFVLSISSGLFFLKVNQNSKLLLQYELMLKNKDFENATKTYEKLNKGRLGFINKRKKLHEKQSHLYLRQKKYDLAEKTIKNALDEHPYNFILWKKLGDISIKKNKYPKARYSYKQALLYNCDYIPASIGLLKSEKKLNNYKNIKAIKNELLYINSYINQFEINEAIWGKHKKLNDIYINYKKYKKQIDRI